MSFFPRADAAILQSGYALAQQRPRLVDPILDPDNASRPIIPWSTTDSQAYYPAKDTEYAPSSIPTIPSIADDEYLHPILTRNERLRLTMLWYFTRDLDKDQELLSRLQARVHAAQTSVGWEFGIIGLVDYNTFTRLSAVGLPLAILPRRESTCSHTVNQPPDATFMLPNMAEDWRFKESPHVKHGGLRAYAGVPLTLETEFGDSVALGSLCVASSAPQAPLKDVEQVGLQRLAQWVVADIVHSARLRRQKDRHRMLELLSKAREQMRDSSDDSSVLNILGSTYPGARINLQACYKYQILVEGREPIDWTQFQNGLWEDATSIDNFIFAPHNQSTFRGGKTLRIIAAACQSTAVPTFLTVSTTDIRDIYDDIDAWFVNTCAEMLSQAWQSRMLREAVKAKDKFLRGITHQLRTPLHGILGSTDLLAEELRLQNLVGATLSAQAVAAEVEKTLDGSGPMAYINIIRSSGRDLIAIVNSILTLNRWQDISTITRHDEPYSFDLVEAELCKGIDDVSSGDARYTSCVVLRSEVPVDCDIVCMDLNFLKDCIVPLILNAIQSRSRGIVAVVISAHDYSRLAIDIEDGGCGIRPDLRERIFEAYEKGDAHSTGAGLGLTLASKFAILLGGTISLVKTEVGKGSHFRVVFENVALACSLKQAPLPPLNKQKSLPSTFRRVQTKLEDGPCLSDQLVKFLTREGYTETPNKAEESFSVLDYQEDVNHMLQAFKSVPPTQVALCAIPPWAKGHDLESIPNNIVLIKSPFVTASMSAAVDKADSIFATLRDSTALPIATLSHPADGSISADTSSALYPTSSSSPLPHRPKIATPPTVTVSVPPSIVSEVHIGTSDDSVTPPTIIPSSNLTQSAPKPALLAATIIPHSHRSTNPTTLIVDDNRVNLQIMQMYCKRRRLPSHKAVDGSLALETFTTHNQEAAKTGGPLIELILMDLQMPVMDGIEATRRIRLAEADNGWQRCVIFIVTGQDSPGDRIDAKQAGADGFFVKPTDIKLLDAGIRMYFVGFAPTGNK